MPTYEFKCEDCKHIIEVFASISAKEKGLDITCDQCGGKNVHQGVTTFLFYSAGAFKESSNKPSHSPASSCSSCSSGSCASCH